MKALFKKFDINKEYFTSEQCYITEISNSDDDQDVSIAQARVKAGVTTRWHLLNNTVERYYIISGEGRADIGDLPSQLMLPGDCIIIPADCKQRICNTGSDDLIFLAICSPRFLLNNYHELED